MDDLNEVRTKYQKQCPVLWNQGMSTDTSLLYVLAIGVKHRIDYLQHLVDCFTKDRLASIASGTAKEPTEAEWSLSHKHFRKLKNKNIKINLEKLNLEDSHKKVAKYNDLAVSAVLSFGHRFMSKLQFNSMKLIQDSMEQTLLYMLNAVTFITNLTSTASKVKQGICPFQLDVCIASGKPAIRQQGGIQGVHDDLESDDDSEDDDDDDDDDDNKGSQRYVDYVGDIENKLKVNKLRYEEGENAPSDDGRSQGRMFANLYKKLEGEAAKSDTEYFYRKRLVVMVDRRSSKMDGKAADKLWMYEPPANCFEIPEDVVPEWYISSSRTSLLPDTKYGNGRKAEGGDVKGGDVKEQEEEEEEEMGDPTKERNIGTYFDCSGSLLTLSFHVKQENVVKCYL